MRRGSIRSRLQAVAKQATVAERPAAEPWPVVWARRVAAFAGHIPTDLREAFRARALADVSGETFPTWLRHPFARWAPPMPPGYLFPRALVEFVLDPPRRIWFGHHCELCGLAVPLFSTWSDDPDPPPALSPFPVCPACGGRTSFMASYQTGPLREVTCGVA